MFMTVALTCQGQAPIQFQEPYSENTLSQNYITCIYQDHRGYLWIGTFNGLNRYDGHKFEHYLHNPKDSLSLINNSINTIYEDKNGNLWIGTQNGICFYDAQINGFIELCTKSNYNFKLSHNEIRAIHIDNQNIMWIGTYGGGIDRIDLNNKNIKNFTYNPNVQGSLLSEKINCFFVDNEQQFWIGTEGGGISLLDKETLKFKSFGNNAQNSYLLNSSVVNCILQDKIDTDILWIGTWNNGLIKFQKNLGLIENYINIPNQSNSLSNNTVRSLDQDANGNLWVGTFGGGLNLFDQKTGNFKTYTNNPTDPSSLAYNIVWSTYIDKSGILWIGTFGGGLNKCIIPNHKIIHLKSGSGGKNMLNNNSVSAIIVDHNGLIWIGTIGSGINVYNPKTKEYKYYLHNKKKGAVVRTIYEDKLNRIWIATEEGLYCYNPTTQKISLYNNALLYKPIYSIYEDHLNNLWFGTFDAGLIMLSRKESLKINTLDAIPKHYLNNPSDSLTIASNKIWNIFEDSDSTLWFGSFLGLEKFNRETETFKNINTNLNSTLPSDQYQLNTIIGGGNNILWLGTDGSGLASFNKKTQQLLYYDTPKVIHGILIDEDSILWIGTGSKGLYKFNPKSKQITQLAQHHELQGYDFERNAFAKLGTGKLAFGGNDGVIIFHPDSLTENQINPPIVISDFKLFNQSVAALSKTDQRFKAHISELKKIELSYKENVFAIEFSALDFRIANNHTFAYKLEGFNDDWIYTDTKNNLATYTNLNGGNYKFRVTTLNTDNSHNSNEAVLTIVIQPPFWKTWWFIVGLSALVLLLIAHIVRRRLNTYKQQKAELEKLVDSKTIELRKQKDELEHSNTELQKQKEEIISQRDNMKELKDKVVEANQRKMRFFTNISHELRTPLTLLISPINRVLKQHKVAKNIVNDLQLVQRNALRLQKLVNQLMDFRKIETGTMPLLVSENDIISAIAEIKESFADIAKQYNINYTFSSSISSKTCWFDPDKIEKIIYNLLSNAFKHTESQGNIIIKAKHLASIANCESYSNKLASINIKPLGEGIEIEVRDTGMGIAKDNLEHIFNRFYQIENAKASLQESTGIGLAMTKDLIEIHKGQITVNSKLGKGTSFKVILPISKEFYTENNMAEVLNLHPREQNTESIIIEEDFHKNIPINIDSNENCDHSKGLILIVEDNRDLRLFLKSCFSDYYNVIEAENGAQGIEMTIKHQPSLIISDIMMPVINGIELCKSIKQNIETSHIPIILLTARTLVEHQLEGLETGADDYITKPFESEVLQLKVRNIIETRKKISESFHKSIEVKASDIAISSVDNEFLSNAIDIINNNLTNSEFNVDAFTKEMAMGRTLFYQKIKVLTNQSVNDFIQTVKLKKAVQLMNNSNLRVSDICYEIGFSSPRYFATCFKKQFGKTPTEYMEQTKN
jgi:signal transduction histidine kinase/ligand-binding sensor domain-containing protein/DNA-binding response OmpR family regulator